MTEETDVTLKATKLMPAFEEFSKAEYREWRKSNPAPFMADLIWNPNWIFDKADERNLAWFKHIVPLAKKWWSRHSFTYEQSSRCQPPTLSI